MSKKKNLLITSVAGVAGMALLAGGVTFALWQDSETIPGATVTAGTLDITQVGSQVWHDVSADVAGAPVAIDPATFRIVPGDTIRGAQAIGVELDGDNIQADLTALIPVGGAISGALADVAQGVSGTIFLIEGAYDAATFTPADAIASAALDGTNNTVATYRFENGVDTPTNGGTPTDDVQALTAVIQLSFNASTPERVRTAAAAEIDGIEFQLVQNRTDLGL
jgi:predicted ribosomally synthesized peptide with SipW-like signal peptide